MKKRVSHWPLTLLSVLGSTLNIFLPFFLARILLPEQFATYKIFFLYLVLVPWIFLAGGFVNGLLHWAGKKSQAKGAFQTTFTFMVLIASVVFIFGMIGARAFSNWVDWPLHITHWFIVGAAFSILANFYDESQVALGHIWKGAFFSSGFEFVRSVTILALAVYSRDIEAIFVAHASLTALKAIVGIFLSFRNDSARFSFDKTLIISVLKYSIPVSLSAGFSVITNYADQLLLSQWIPPSEFIFYSLGCFAIPPLILFEQTVNRVLIPEMSEAFANQRNSLAQDAMRDAISEISWIMIPTSIGLFLFAPEIISVLYTDRYIAAADYLRIFSFSYLLFSMPHDSVARALGNGNRILRQLIIFSTISLVLISTGLMSFGPKAALIGMIVGQILLRASGMHWTHMQLQWKARNTFDTYLLFRFIVLALVFGLLGKLISIFYQNSLSKLLFGGGLFAIAYLSTTFRYIIRAIYTRHQDKTKPKVILLTQYLGLGGLERMVLNLAKSLKNDHNYSPSIFVYDEIVGKATLHNEFKELGIAITTVAKGRGFSFVSLYKLLKLIAREKTLAIHSHDLGALIYASMAKIAFFGSIRIIHTQHSFVHLSRSPRYIWYERFFTFFANEIVVVSNLMIQEYSRLHITNRIPVTIPNGVEFATNEMIDRKRERLSLIDSEIEDPVVSEAIKARINTIWVLALARVHPGKGQDHLIQIWSLLNPAIRKQASLLIVGQETKAGELAKLINSINEAQIQESCLYLGFTRNSLNYYKNADLFASGSDFEGMPLGPVEALGSGVGLFLSDIPGHLVVPNLLQVQKFKIRDYKQAAALLETMIQKIISSDPKLLRNQNLIATQSIRDNFGIFEMAKQYSLLYFPKNQSTH